MPLHSETRSAHIYFNNLQSLRFDNHTKPCRDFGFIPINRAALTETKSIPTLLKWRKEQFNAAKIWRYGLSSVVAKINLLLLLHITRLKLAGQLSLLNISELLVPELKRKTRLTVSRLPKNDVPCTEYLIYCYISLFLYLLVSFTINRDFR